MHRARIGDDDGPSGHLDVPDPYAFDQHPAVVAEVRDQRVEDLHRAELRLLLQPDRAAGDDFLGVLPPQPGQDRALQQAELGRGVAGRPGADAPCLEDGNPHAGAGQQQGRRHPGKPCPSHHGVVIRTGTERVGGDNMLPVKPQRSHDQRS